jgi:hypothetical protein
MVTFARSGLTCYPRLGLDERASRGARDWPTRRTSDNERMRASQRSRAKYPLATICAYGPDNRRATKLVVGILRRAGQKDPNPMRSWSSDPGDVRNDPVIAAELADWLRTQGVKDSVSYDRILGCPHEEGIDYPIGRTCPQCPFWAAIDRLNSSELHRIPPLPSAGRLRQRSPKVRPADVLAEGCLRSVSPEARILSYGAKDGSRGLHDR